MKNILILLILSCGYITLKNKSSDEELKKLPSFLKVLKENDLDALKSIIEDFNLQNSIDDLYIRVPFKEKDEQYRIRMNSLMYASNKLLFDIIEYLLTLKADVNKGYQKSHYKQYRSAFVYFLLSSKNVGSINRKIFKLFLDKGGYFTGMYSDDSALCTVIDLDDELSLDILLKHFAGNESKLKNKSIMPESILSYACSSGSLKCINYLLDNGHDIGNNGLNESCLNDGINDFDVVKLLLSRGADPKKISLKGLIKLRRKCKNNEGIAILKHLLTLGMNIDQGFLKEDKNSRRNIFTYLASNDNVEMFKLCLENCCLNSDEDKETIKLEKLYSRDRFNKNTLMYSTKYHEIKYTSTNNKNMITYLLEEGINPSEYDRPYSKSTLPRTALQYIEESENLESILPVFLANDKYNFSDCTYIIKKLRDKDTIMLYLDHMKNFYLKCNSYKESAKAVYYIHPASRFKDPDIRDKYIDVIISIIISLSKHENKYLLENLIKYKDIIFAVSEFF